MPDTGHEESDGWAVCRGGLAPGPAERLGCLFKQESRARPAARQRFGKPFLRPCPHVSTARLAPVNKGGHMGSGLRFLALGQREFNARPFEQDRLKAMIIAHPSRRTHALCTLYHRAMPAQEGKRCSGQRELRIGRPLHGAHARSGHQHGFHAHAPRPKRETARSAMPLAHQARRGIGPDARREIRLYWIGLCPIHHFRHFRRRRHLALTARPGQRGIARGAQGGKPGDIGIHVHRAQRIGIGPADRPLIAGACNAQTVPGLRQPPALIPAHSGACASSPSSRSAKLAAASAIVRCSCVSSAVWNARIHCPIIARPSPR